MVRPVYDCEQFVPSVVDWACRLFGWGLLHIEQFPKFTGPKNRKKGQKLELEYEPDVIVTFCARQVAGVEDHQTQGTVFEISVHVLQAMKNRIDRPGSGLETLPPEGNLFDGII